MLTQERPKHWKRLRFHYTSTGYPKIKYSSKENANLAARAVNEKKRFGEDQLVSSYVCKICQFWHVGRSSQAKKDTSLWQEIGDRAYYNLCAENTGSLQKRTMRIRNRFRFLGPEYGVDRLM